MGSPRGFALRSFIGGNNSVWSGPKTPVAPTVTPSIPGTSPSDFGKPPAPSQVFGDAAKVWGKNDLDYKENSPMLDYNAWYSGANKQVSDAANQQAYKLYTKQWGQQKSEYEQNKKNTWNQTGYGAQKNPFYGNQNPLYGGFKN